MELEQGALLMERRDRAQGAFLRVWLDTQALVAFPGRVLPIDLAVAPRCTSPTRARSGTP